MPRYHKWPNFEVLEILANDNKKLIGFRVHFSNGSSAKFARTNAGLDCTNIFFERDGTLGLMAGQLDKLEENWKIDGKIADFGGKNFIR